jgi:hypothetical protein
MLSKIETPLALGRQGVEARTRVDRHRVRGAGAVKLGHHPSGLAQHLDFVALAGQLVYLEPFGLGVNVGVEALLAIVVARPHHARPVVA